MSAKTVRLPRTIAEQMIAHAREGKPEEICGLVAGDASGRPVAFFRVPNIATNKIITYHMDPHTQLQAFREMESRGWQLHGIYHSHPATQAYPSETDRGLAFDPFDNQPLYPDTIYYIISLADETRPVIRGFLLPDPDTIEEVHIEIEDE